MKIIRPVEMTDGIITENTAYPPSVNEWESAGYAFISDLIGPINQMEFSGSEDKLWVTLGGTGGVGSGSSNTFLAEVGGSSLTSTSIYNGGLLSVSAEPDGPRLAQAYEGDTLRIINNDFSVSESTTDTLPGTVTESKIIWSGSHIYWLRRYTSGSANNWTLTKWTEALTKVWTRTFDTPHTSVSLLDVIGQKILVAATQDAIFDYIRIYSTESAAQEFGDEITVTPHSGVILPDESAIYFTVRGEFRGLYRMDDAGETFTSYTEPSRIIEPSGQPTEPGEIRLSGDGASMSVSSGFGSHIIDVATESFVSGTTRGIFKTYEEAPAIPFSRNDGYIAVHPKQPDELGMYNLWDTTNWEQVTDEVSDYLSGDRVYQGKNLYEALVDNPSQSPENGTTTEPQQWLKTGSINPWRMFDQATNTQTSGASPMTVSFEPGVLVNGIALFEVNAGFLRITMTDPVEGLVYDSGEIQMLDNSSITDWYAYFFEPYVPRPDIALLDLPPYPDAEITVTLTSEGQDVQVGEIVLGSIQRLGAAQYGTSVGIIDFSRKEQDQFGNFSILQRRFSKRADYDVKINTSGASGVQRTLANYRTTPVVWVGDENKDETIVYGYYRDFEILLSGPSLSDCTITVEGL